MFRTCFLAGLARNRCQRKGLETFVEEKAGQSERSDKVERGVFELLLDLGRRLMESFFTMSGDGDVGETWERHGTSLGERMESRGLLGIAHGPADLSTNPKHLEGFGSDGH